MSTKLRPGLLPNSTEHLSENSSEIQDNDFPTPHFVLTKRNSAISEYELHLHMKTPDSCSSGVDDVKFGQFEDFLKRSYSTSNPRETAAHLHGSGCGESQEDRAPLWSWDVHKLGCSQLTVMPRSHLSTLPHLRHFCSSAQHLHEHKKAPEKHSL